MRTVKYSWRLFLASVAATAIFWLPLSAAALYTVKAAAFIRTENLADPISRRGAAIFLLLLPAISAISLAVSYAAGAFLKAKGLISLRAAWFVALALNFYLALFFSQAQPAARTARAYLDAFALVALFFAPLLMLSGTVWWLVARTDGGRGRPKLEAPAPQS